MVLDLVMISAHKMILDLISMVTLRYDRQLGAPYNMVSLINL